VAAAEHDDGARQAQALQGPSMLGLMPWLGYAQRRSVWRRMRVEACSPVSRRWSRWMRLSIFILISEFLEAAPAATALMLGAEACRSGRHRRCAGGTGLGRAGLLGGHQASQRHQRQARELRVLILAKSFKGLARRVA